MSTKSKRPSRVTVGARSGYKLTMTTNDNQGPGRPPIPDDQRADSQIQLRVTKKRKGAYVAAANKKKQTLAAWMFEVCDGAAGYRPPN